MADELCRILEFLEVEEHSRRVVRGAVKVYRRGRTLPSDYVERVLLGVLS